MDAVKKDLLEESYDRIINVGLCIVPYEDLSDIAAPEVMLFGTTKDEKLFSFRDLDAMFKSQYEQMDGFVPSLDRKRLFTRTSNDGNNAFITEEVILTITSPEEVNTIVMLVSFMMEYIDSRWKLTHWHTSTPVDTENDHWHQEEWKREKEKLQKLVDEQTADLHGKNKELEIEASIERVRAVAMSMNKPEDMLRVCRVISDQLQQFGVEHIRNVQTVIINEEKGTYHNYQYFTPYKTESVELTECDKNPVVYEMVTRMLESADAFFTTNLTGDELATFRSYRKQENQFPNPLLDETESIDGHFFSIGPGGLGITLYRPLNEEGLQIFKRFHNVFSLAYRRFRDIEKAEEQAREVEVELALERVRARTMAMQRSDELIETSELMFEQIKNLGIELWSCGFSLWNDDDSYFMGYNPGPDGKMGTPLRIPLTEDVFFTTIREAKRRGDDFLVFESEGESLKQTYRYMDNLPVVGENMRGIVEAGYPLPTYQVTHCGFFSKGHLMFITQEPNPDAVDIFKRFTNVFDQTYTRFLDLQKAETQAREAQIELSLERIRAQATAMQESSDLLDIVVTMRTEFVNLGHEAHYFWHMRWLPERYDKAMTSGDGSRIGMVMTLPRHIHGDIEALAEWEKSNKPTYVLAMDVDTAVDYVDKMISLGDFEQLDPQAPTLDDIRHIGGLTFIMARTTHGEIGYSLPGVVPDPPKDAVDTLVRFAGVFDLAYRRFEDLKKAEAQARENQIELALERVRARTMAMQKSEELAEVAFVLFEQLRELGADLWGTGFGLCDKTSDKDSFWFANENGVFPPVAIPNTTDPAHSKMYEGWKAGKDFLALEASGKKLKSHYDYMLSLHEVKSFFQKILDEGLSLPEWQQWNAAYFKHGYLLIITLEPYPDPDILVRFAGVFDQTYTRFLDLKNAEAQAKEANIQLALERVRAKTMAMKTQGDLLGIIELFGEQLNAVDVRFDDVTIIDGPITKNRDWELWSFVPEAENLSHKILIPYIDTPYFTKTAEAVEEYEKTGNPIQVKSFTKKEKDEFIDHYRKYAPEVVDEVSDLVYANPGSVILDAFLEEVTISLVRWDLELYTDEELEIFERFAKEFRRTYIRFLDIIKAEEQARESEIQLALERVRAKSMAMHKSDELADLSMELVQQVQALGIETWFCAFNIYDDHPDGSLEWGSNGQGTFPKYRTRREGVFLDYYEAGQRGEALLINEIGEEECPAHYHYLCSLPGVGDQLLKIKAEGIPFPDSQIDHVAFFKYGYILFITFEPVPESHDIFKRFASVFQQTYTRFLDLQKSEEQAKEAQIEAALERVRSRSLAMHKTDELQDVVRVVAEELKNTGVILDTGGAVICTYFQDSKDVIHWTATDDPTHPSVPYLLPYFENELFDEAWESKSRGDDYFAKVFSYDVKNAFFSHAFEHSEYRQLPDEYKKIILESKSHGIAWAWAENSAIMIPSIQGDLPSEEEKKTLIRFAKVFEQSFIRFLDLQKAEDQAREAKIEAALEKVRSRTMGMQSSEDLPEVANMLFLEVQALGIPAWSSGFNILAEDKKSAAAWMSSEGTIQDPFTLRLYGEASFDEMGDFIRRNEPFMVQELGGGALREHYKYMKTFPDLKPTFKKLEEQGLSLPTYQINHLCKFSHGFLLFITYEPVPDAHDIFKRFTNVFDQTYTRFLDLKKSEKQAVEATKQASLDRVRGEIASMRSSDELKEVAVELREEMGALGVEELETSSIYIHDDTSGLTQCWFTIKDSDDPGKSVTDQMMIDLQDTLVGRQMDEFYQSDQDSTSILMKGGQRIEWIRYCEEKSDLFGKSEFYGETIPERTYHLYKFSNGFLGAASPGEISDESWDLMRRATNVFSLAYTRFRDLQKADESARRARQQASLDR